jgi:hypothetical protein
VLDELVKIGEAAEAKKGPMGAILAGGAGTALGWGAAELMGRKMKFFSQVPTSPAVLDKRVRAAKFILPILTGAAGILADRYRQSMNEHHRQVPGYQEKK